jgi:alpha-L-fucosidase 2
VRISVLIPLAAMTLLAAAVDRKAVEFAHPGAKPLLLDLHIPDGPGPFPAAILIHGGGFDEGSRFTNVAPLFEPLTNAGFAWFSIDYRLAPEAHFTEANADVNTAIEWLKAHASEYHVDVHKIAIVGESAGGYLVNYAGTHQTPETSVAAVLQAFKVVNVQASNHKRIMIARFQQHRSPCITIAQLCISAASP